MSFNGNDRRGSGASDRTKFRTCSESSTVVFIQGAQWVKGELSSFVLADGLDGLRLWKWIRSIRITPQC